MTVHVALLRAINVAGHANVSMADLRGLFEAMGFEGVQTLLQSGNVVFRSEGKTALELEALLEKEAAGKLSLSTDFMVRTGGDIQAIVAANPFPKEASDDPGHLVVQFLKEAPGADAVRALQAAIPGRELVRAKGKDLYITYPDGIGRSRLTTNLFERKLGTRGTGRNWNTVLKLAQLAGA